MHIRHLVPQLALILTSCATYSPEPLDPAQASAAFERRRLNSAEVIEFVRSGRHAGAGSVPSNWSLDDLCLAAAYFDPAIELARAHLDEARAGVETAQAIPNPNLEIGPEYYPGSGGSAAWVLGFKLDWPLDLGGVRSVRERIAEAGVRSAECDCVEAAWHTRSKVHAAWIADVASRRELEAAQAESAARATALSGVRRRLQAGEAARADLAEVEIDLQRLDRDVLVLRSRAQELRAELARAVAVPVAALADLAVDPTGFEELPPVPTADSARTLGLRRRADIARALAEYDSAEAELELEIAKTRPALHLLPGFAWDRGERRFDLGLSLPLPIFDRNRGPIAQAEAHRRVVAARFESQQADVIGAIQTSRAHYAASLVALDASRALVERRAAELGIAERGLDLGELDATSVDAARVLHAAAQRLAVDAAAQARRSRLGLELAMSATLEEAESATSLTTSEPTP